MFPRKRKDHFWITADIVKANGGEATTEALVKDWTVYITYSKRLSLKSSEPQKLDQKSNDWGSQRVALLFFLKTILNYVLQQY